MRVASIAIPTVMLTTTIRVGPPVERQLRYVQSVENRLCFILPNLQPDLLKSCPGLAVGFVMSCCFRHERAFLVARPLPFPCDCCLSLWCARATIKVIQGEGSFFCPKSNSAYGLLTP